nr:hypothetical protein HMPREF0276_1785 [Corynebacterium accolens ATCC 49725]
MYFGESYPRSSTRSNILPSVSYKKYGYVGLETIQSFAVVA